MAAGILSIPIIHLGAIALFALLLGLLFVRLKLPAILAYLLAGVILGPLGFSYLAYPSGLWPLAYQFGLLGLLFYLGLELDARRLKQSTFATAFSLLFSAVAFAAGFAGASLLGFDILESLLSGALIAFSSTVAGLPRLLPRLQATGHAFLAVGGAAGILLWVGFAGAVAASANTVAFGVLLFLVFLFGIRFCAKRIQQWLPVKRADEGMLVFSLLSGLVTAYFMDSLLFLPAVGAYFAGVALSASKAGERIRGELPLFREAMVVFFFTSIGALFVPNATALALAGVLFLFYLGAKALLFYGFGRRFGLRKDFAGLGQATLSLGENTLLLAVASLALIQQGPIFLSASILLVAATSILSAFGPLRPFTPSVASKPVSERVNELAWSSLKSAIGYAGVAVLVTFLASSFFSLSRFPRLFGFEPVFVGGLLLLPFVVWPLYKSLTEFRFAVSVGAEHWFGPKIALEAGQALTGGFTLIASLFTFSLMYALNTSWPFLVLSGVYVVLSVLFVSHLLWSRPDYLEKNAFLVSTGFLSESRDIADLNNQRILVQRRIAKALAKNDKTLAKKLLSDFRKQEAFILDKTGKRTAVHPLKAKSKRRPYLENYFLGKKRG